MPEISVVVPVYNSEKYLSNCLESLIQQTFCDIEIICVDDGSTDNSLEILKKYEGKDKRIKVFTQENQGVAVARNRAMGEAAGTWLAFCDSDDMVPLNAYEKMHKKTKKSDMDIIIGNYYDINDNGEKKYIDCRGSYKTDLFYSLFKVPCVWTKLIRKDFVEQHLLQFKSVDLGEDVLFLADVVVKRPTFYVLSAPVYYHWNHNNVQSPSLNHQYSLKRFHQHIYCRAQLKYICGEMAGYDQVYHYIYHDMMGFLLNFLYRIIDTTERRQAFSELQKFVQGYDWSHEQEQFKCMMGVPYEEFIRLDADEFFSKTNVIDHAEIVIDQYEAGMLGFRYILKYMKAWAKYKMKRFQMERKK